MQRLLTLVQLGRLLGRTGRWWLVPMVAVFLLTAGLLVLVQVVEYAAPFVYTIF